MEWGECIESKSGSTQAEVRAFMINLISKLLKAAEI